MRLRTKLTLAIVPIVAAAGILSGAAVFGISVYASRRLYLELLELRSAAYLRQVQAEHAVITRLGIADSPFYARSAQNRAIELATAESTGGVGIVVLDADSRVLASPWERVGASSAMAQADGGERLRNGSGDLRLGRGAFLGKTVGFEPWGWTIVLALPTKLLVRSASAALPAVGVVVGLGVAFAGFLARRLGRGIAAPLERLAATTVRMGEGDLSARASEESEGEARELARAFNDMAGRLATATAGLEVQVRERTAELRRTIDELEEAKDELVRKEKLAALGGLVAGVAHEVNTPLGVSITAASYLGDETARMARDVATGSADIDAYLKSASESTSMILANLDRAKIILTSFRELAVDQQSDLRRRIDLGLYLGEIIDTLMPVIRRNGVRVDLDCPQGMELFTLPSSLIQIVSNLVMNSINHAFTKDAPGSIRIDVRADAGSIVMRYRDDGKGMDRETASRAFEPFFTTRRGSGGTGLGLAIVENAVSSILGGTIRMDTAPGEGCAYEIRFPR